jgi:hypothetical protein
LPTLKPDLTASAPRLDTGVWLTLTRLGSHQLYSQRRTGAPPLADFNICVKLKPLKYVFYGNYHLIYANNLVTV